MSVPELSSPNVVKTHWVSVYLAGLEDTVQYRPVTYAALIHTKKRYTIEQIRLFHVNGIRGFTSFIIRWHTCWEAGEILQRDLEGKTDSWNYSWTTWTTMLCQIRRMKGVIIPLCRRRAHLGRRSLTRMTPAWWFGGISCSFLSVCNTVKWKPELSWSES